MQQDWLSLLTNVGAPCALLVGLMYAAWKSAGWVGRELIIPLRDVLLRRVTAFFDRLDRTIEALEGHAQKQAAAAEQTARAIEALRADLRRPSANGAQAAGT